MDRPSIWATVGAIAGVILLLAFLLRLLYWINSMQYDAMTKKIDVIDANRASNPDPFRMTNHYSYDWCLVFKVHTEDAKAKLNEYQKEFSMEVVVARLTKAGFETSLFYSAQADEVYCKIRALPDRLRAEADRINLKVKYDPHLLQQALEKGRDDKWKPVKIVDELNECTYSPYDYIYGKYEFQREEVESLYAKTADGACFRGVDRLKLMYSIMTSKPADGGCGLNLGKLKQTQALLAYMPLHDKKEQLVVMRQSVQLVQMPWHWPSELVKDYYGEKVGLYFVWLAHYTTWLIVPSIVGVGVWIHIASTNNDPNAPSVPFFAGFVAIWSTLYLESWKRTEKQTAMEWGMVGFEEEEQVRPEFIGEKASDPVTGKPRLYFPKDSATRRFITSQVVVIMMICVVVASVGSIFLLKYFMNYKWTGTAEYGSIVASILNAIQIQIMNVVYSTLALALNNWENHRTDTSFEDNLIAKTFMFQFVNSYASFFYIAFIKKWTQDKCLGGCMVELSVQLGSIFITRIVQGNLTEVLVPLINAQLRLRAETSGGGDANKKSSASNEKMSLPTSMDAKVSPMEFGNGGDVESQTPSTTPTAGASALSETGPIPTYVASEIEKEFLLEEQDVLLSTFNNYCEMAIQYGYSTLFVAAYPLSMPLSLLNNYLELRVDAYTLGALSRRPEPRSAEDIGAWYSIIDTISTICVITNAALIVFTSDVVESWTTPWGRVWVFIIIEHIILGLKWILSYAIPDVSSSCEIQIKRSEYINGKIIDNVQDEDDDDVVGFSHDHHDDEENIRKMGPLHIMNTDDDNVVV